MSEDKTEIEAQVQFRSASHSRMRDEDDDHEAHADDERWLVSYADMMTLLFGLFVMLYALAMDKKGDLEAAVSALTGRTPKQGVPSAASGPITGMVGGQAEAPIEDAKALRDEINELRGKIGEREDEIRSLKEALARSPSGIPSAGSFIASGSGGVATGTAGLSEPSDAEKRSRAAAREKALLAKSLEKAKGERVGLQGKLEDKEKALESLKAELAQKEETMEKARAELAAMTQENAELKSKIDRELGSFMMVALKWGTDKHDLDLRVREPGGQSFDYNNRKRSGSPAAFLVDTRTGPGVELWQTPKLVPGAYSVTVAFYSDYGNSAPAEYELLVATKKGVFRLPKSKLDIQKNSRQFRLTVTSDGDVAFN